MKRARGWAIAARGLAVALVAGGCGSIFPTAATPSTGPDYTLHVSNGTTLALTVVVNDQPVGVAAAQQLSDFPIAALPPLPWTVDLRTVSGRSVLGVHAGAGSVIDVQNADGSRMHSAPGARADLSCGRLDVYLGTTPVMGPAPGAGEPGDCVP